MINEREQFAKHSGAEKKKGYHSAAKNITQIALFTALICVCSCITVPFGAIPFTLQTFAVAAAGALLGPKKGFFAVVTYLLMGLIGIPVFSGFRAGYTVLVGGTGGYLFGFMFMAVIVGWSKKIRVKHFLARTAIFYGASWLGMAICYLFGTLWYMLMMKCDFAYAVTACVLPFLLADAVKFAVAAPLCARLEKYLK